ncbi:MAG: hypothetical protein ABIO92_05630, partial [Chloroflexia bacterium]
HHQSIANWVKAAEQTLPEQVADQTATGTVEIDELFTFIGKKTNRGYVVMALSRYSRLIVGAEVMWQRTWENREDARSGCQYSCGKLLLLR